MTRRRKIPVVPNSIVDRDGAPHFGSFSGELPTVALDRLRGEYAPAWWKWKIRRKRWHYVIAVTDEVILCQAVVDGRYFGQSFFYAVDLYEERVVVHNTFTGLPDIQARVNDRPARGHLAAFGAPGVHLSTHRGPVSDPYQWKATLNSFITGEPGGLTLDAQIDPRGQSPALTVIAPVLDGGIVNVTQKWAGLPTTGRLKVGSRSYRLDDGVAGLDYTQGILGRRTAWRWSMALGHLSDGRRVGINLVAGFNDDHPTANENALWVGDRLIPLERAEFEFEKDDPSRPWSVRTFDGVVDLYFQPYYVHRDVRNMGVINSYFIQPAGRFDGRIVLDGTTHHVVLHGVTEDQDVRW